MSAGNCRARPRSRTNKLLLGVSYDDKTTYQQKVEFANARGLGGLMIWAIDQDDERYTALESLLGKDIDPGVDLSPTVDSDQFELSSCMYTNCGDVCPDGTKQMVSGHQVYTQNYRDVFG